MIAYLLDDEKNALLLLKSMIEKNCPEISSVLHFNDPIELKKQLSKTTPDVLFLDIEMPEINGFDFLNQLKEINFQIIFTTAYNQYAIKAIKAQALDYLLKPIHKNELKEAVKKVKLKESKSTNLNNLLNLLNKPSKIAIPIRNGHELINQEEIVYAKADGSYSILNYIDQKKTTISKNIKYLESILNPNLFLRVHNSYIINSNRIKQIRKDDGGYLIMDDDTIIPISNSKKKVFESFLKGL